MPAVNSLKGQKLGGTTQPPKPKNLPYIQEGGAGSKQLLPVVSAPSAPKEYTPAQLEKGSQNVMGTAQGMAIQKAKQPDPTMGLVQQQTQQIIKEPELVTDKYIQNQIDQYNRQRAGQMTAFQQLYADTANTGVTREAAYNFAMEGAQGRVDLENQLRQEQAIKNRQAKLDALNLGMSTARTTSGLDTEAFNRLITARGAYEGERSQKSSQGFTKEMTAVEQANRLEYLQADQAGRMALTELQGKIQKDQLLTQQDFAESQAALDRALKDAEMKGDWTSAENITRLKGQIDAQAQASQQAWAATQNALDRDNQVLLTELKGNIQKGLLVEENKFAEIQNGLDRDLERYKTDGDWANAEKITRLKGQIESQAQQARQEWATSERIATQSWQTDERIDEQAFNRATQVLEHKQRLAVQANDIVSAEKIAQQRNELQLKMQLQEFSHDEKMTRLDADIADAQATKDFGRQKQLMEYKSLLNLQEMAKEQGYNVARMNLQKEIETALQNNDHTNAMSMLDAQQRFAAEEAVKDRAIDFAKVELQKRGVDMAEMEARYNMLIKGGDPDGAFNYLQGEMKKNGITMNKADEDAVHQALADDYRQQQFVFALSNPDKATWVNKEGKQVPKGTPGAKFGGLKEEAAETFNSFINKTYYGKDGKPVTSGQAINSPGSDIVFKSMAGGKKGLWKNVNGSFHQLNPEETALALRGAVNDSNQNNEVYQQLLNNAPTANIRISNTQKNKISGVPAKDSMLNINGRLFIITKGKYREKSGRNHDEFEIMDVSTGAKKTFEGLTGTPESLVTMDNWVAALKSGS